MVRSAERVFGRCFASPENHEAPSVAVILRDARFSRAPQDEEFE
jgi:hypothetical protein